jgi:phosphoglycerate dehydrogenase-like enzyme
MGIAENEFAELKKAAPSNITFVTPLPMHANAVTSVVPDRPDPEHMPALLEAVAGADAIIGDPSQEVVRAAKKLKWVALLSAGIEAYRFPELMNPSIVVTNARGVASPAIADHAFAMLLALTRGIPTFLDLKAKQVYSRVPYPLLELKDKTAVIIGVGNIGTQVAQRARAFDMNVIGVDVQQMPPTQNVPRMVYPDQLDQVIPLADVVFMCAPFTPESSKMMGPKQFELMKKGSYFVAVSRGGTYDLDALVKALDSKRLAGAGVDVMTPEPLPKGHPFWSFPNVIITPHVATISEMEIPRRLEMLKQNVVRFAKDQPLVNIVDVKRGY